MQACSSCCQARLDTKYKGDWAEISVRTGCRQQFPMTIVHDLRRACSLLQCVGPSSTGHYLLNSNAQSASSEQWLQAQAMHGTFVLTLRMHSHDTTSYHYAWKVICLTRARHGTKVIYHYGYIASQLNDHFCPCTRNCSCTMDAPIFLNMICRQVLDVPAWSRSQAQRPQLTSQDCR